MKTWHDLTIEQIEGSKVMHMHPERERDIIRSRFTGITYKEIAKRYKVTGVRIRQLELQVLSRIRSELGRCGSCGGTKPDLRSGKNGLLCAICRQNILRRKDGYSPISRLLPTPKYHFTIRLEVQTDAPDSFAKDVESALKKQFKSKVVYLGRDPHPY